MEDNNFNTPEQEPFKKPESLQPKDPQQTEAPQQQQAAPRSFQQRIDLTPVQSKIDQVFSECSKIIIGQKELIELMVTCILSDGHILLEGVPGIAKTLSARVISKTIDVDFSRIQFTPDLMPADIIGTSIFNMKSSEFIFKKGPVFSNVVLIDEINRAPAKTQAALFEVMEEKQISFDGVTYPMSAPFVVIATQNPVEQEGTYRLPEAQLDRFLMKINLRYPNQDEEYQILQRFKNQLGPVDISLITKVLNPESIKEIQSLLAKVHVEDQMLQYITQLVQETRNHAKIYLGASPRASLAILKTSKVTAVINGRDFVIPDDIQYVTPHILNHRLILTPDAEMEGLDSFKIIDEIIKTLEVPR